MLAQKSFHYKKNFNGSIIKDSFLTIDEIKLQYNNLEKYYLNFLK